MSSKTKTISDSVTDKNSNPIVKQKIASITNKTIIVNMHKK